MFLSQKIQGQLKEPRNFGITREPEPVLEGGDHVPHREHLPGEGQGHIVRGDVGPLGVHPPLSQEICNETGKSWEPSHSRTLFYSVKGILV